MPYTVTDFRETPNPNALKCVLDKAPTPVGDGSRGGAEIPRLSRSYRSAGEAAGDPVAAALFRVVGVSGILIHHEGWITVSKANGYAWGPIKAGVTDVLRAAS